jgi:triacylglycerol esterase/lipase EstA (alpha/beta hydrolase family)
MLARLQRVVTFSLLAAALAWVAWGLIGGHPWLAFGGATLLLTGHALVLAAEFAAAAASGRNDPAPRAHIRQLVTAWWGEAVTAPTVFCWRQPFQSQRHPDYLPSCAEGKHGVLLVHGFFCNRGFWNPWLERLHEAKVPVIAVNLEPVLGSIEGYHPTIENAVQHLERTTRKPPIVVAHSMGGLAVRGWLAAQPSGAARAHRVAHVITLGTPHSGTELARLAVSQNGREMRRHSVWLQALARKEAAQPQPPYTCFYSHCDNIVFPPSTATLPLADNRHLAATAHVHMVEHPAPWRLLQQLLQLPKP